MKRPQTAHLELASATDAATIIFARFSDRLGGATE
jgi:hypothetical protein